MNRQETKFCTVALRRVSEGDENGVDLSQFSSHPTARASICTFRVLREVASVRHGVLPPMLTPDAHEATAFADEALSWATPTSSPRAKRIAVLAAWVLLGAERRVLGTVHNAPHVIVSAAFRAGNGPHVAAVLVHFLRITAPEKTVSKVLQPLPSSPFPGLFVLLAKARETQMFLQCAALSPDAAHKKHENGECPCLMLLRFLG